MFSSCRYLNKQQSETEKESSITKDDLILKLNNLKVDDPDNDEDDDIDDLLNSDFSDDDDSDDDSK